MLNILPLVVCMSSIQLTGEMEKCTENTEFFSYVLQGKVHNIAGKLSLSREELCY